MISVDRKNDTLLVGNFPENGILLPEINDYYQAFFNAFSNNIKNVKFDLLNVKASDFMTIAFLKSCGVLCNKKKAAIDFVNVGNELLESLRKTGFTENGLYNGDGSGEKKRVSVFVTSGEATIKFFEDFRKLLYFTYELFETFMYYLVRPWKINWKETIYYCDKTGADAVPIVVLICFLIGVILAFQGIGQLKVFGLESYVADLVGLSIVRELGPLMVAMICTGRAGSAFAAELGTMKVSEEIDAIKTMGLKPSRILILPKIIGLIIVMPMLTVIGDTVAIIGGGLITQLTSEISSYEYFQRVLDVLIIANLFESIIKSVVFAFLIAAIGCFRGMECSNDAKGVGTATTSSVVSGIFLIILADTLVTFVYPQIIRSFGINY